MELGVGAVAAVGRLRVVAPAVARVGTVELVGAAVGDLDHLGAQLVALVEGAVEAGELVAHSVIPVILALALGEGVVHLGARGPGGAAERGGGGQRARWRNFGASVAHAWEAAYTGPHVLVKSPFGTCDAFHSLQFGVKHG